MHVAALAFFNPVHPFRFLARHRLLALGGAGFCLLVSLCLLVHLWCVPKASFAKKFVWSFVVFLPLFGWLAYLGGFQIPDSHGEPGPPDRVGDG